MIPKHIVIDARIRRSSTGRYVDRLITHLQIVDNFHRYTILVSPDDPWSPASSNFTALPCQYAQFSLNPLQQLGFAYQLYRLRPDLMHFSMTQQPLLYFGTIVTTTHDLTMFRFVRRGKTPKSIFTIKMLAYRFLFHWSHWKSTSIIVPTQYVAEELAIYQPTTKKKIVVTYEASEDKLSLHAKQPSFMEANHKFIMYVGTAFPHKNLPALVKAFELLADKYPDLKLVLVGKKDIHYMELEELIMRSTYSSRIIITGYLEDENLQWLYEHCQAYVFPSLSEGFGLPGLEAMSHGAVVIASELSCLPEVYGNAALYFDPYDPQDAADTISSVLENPQSTKKDMAARAKIQLKKYSWHKMAEDTLIIYKECLRETTDF